MEILINLIVIGLLVLTIWFFFAKKEDNAQVVQQGKIDILVQGGYQPAKIQVRAGEKTVIIFDRQDPSTCVEEVIIPELKVHEFLPLNQKTSITIQPTKKGTIPFHCGMGMVHGKIEVV